MDEDELEDILDVVGGFSKEYKNPPSVRLAKKKTIAVQTKPLVQPKVVAKKTTTKSLPTDAQIMVVPNEQATINGDATVEVAQSNLQANDHLKNTATTSKKRHRKTKREGLVNKAKNHHGELMGDKYTSARTRKILIQLNKFIYPDLKNYQIIEFLLLQSIDQNQELLPPNFKDLI